MLKLYIEAFANTFSYLPIKTNNKTSSDCLLYNYELLYLFEVLVFECSSMISSSVLVEARDLSHIIYCCFFHSVEWSKHVKVSWPGYLAMISSCSSIVKSFEIFFTTSWIGGRQVFLYG